MCIRDRAWKRRTRKRKIASCAVSFSLDDASAETAVGGPADGLAAVDSLTPITHDSPPTSSYRYFWIIGQFQAVRSSPSRLFRNCQDLSSSFSPRQKKKKKRLYDSLSSKIVIFAESCESLCYARTLLTVLVEWCTRLGELSPNNLTGKLKQDFFHCTCFHCYVVPKAGFISIAHTGKRCTQLDLFPLHKLVKSVHDWIYLNCTYW